MQFKSYSDFHKLITEGQASARLSGIWQFHCLNLANMYLYAKQHQIIPSGLKVDFHKHFTDKLTCLGEAIYNEETFRLSRYLYAQNTTVLIKKSHLRRKKCFPNVNNIYIIRRIKKCEVKHHLYIKIQMLLSNY